MSDLRELWQRVEERDRGISQSLFDVVKALVEAVEPEEIPTIEQPIEYHRASARKFHQEAVQAYTELGEAKATIERLHNEVAEAEHAFSRVYRQLTEAKAEIERLNRLLENVATPVDSWMRRCHELGLELAEAKAEIERLRPLAKNWKLVLEMRSGMRLVKDCVQVTPCTARVGYWVENRWPDGTWSKREREYLKNDPAEVLRSIQASE